MLSEYLSLNALAMVLGLPRTYLRDLAEARRIPYLDVNGRKRFDEEQVRQALAKLSCPTRKECVA